MEGEGESATGRSDELELCEAEDPRCPTYAVDANAAAASTTTAVVTPQQQQQRETFFPFSDLPEELALQVLLHVSLADVWAVALASRRLHALCSENLLWGTLAERLWAKADEDLVHRQQQQAVTANASAVAGESEEGSDRGESAVKPEHQPFSLVGHAKVNKHKVALRTIDWKAYTRERLTFERPGALQWIPRRTKKGCHPKARYSHTATTVGSKIYFIGGEYIEPFRLNDIYCFDADTSVWTKIEPKEQNAEVPFLARHTAVAIGHNILVYGGYDGISNFYDIFVFDTVENIWWQPLVSGDVPPPRSNHTAATVGNKMYIFGGLRHKGEEKDQQYTVLGDMYVLDTETWSWRQLGSICHAPDDYLSIYPEHMRPFIANSSSSSPSTSIPPSSDTNSYPLSSSPPDSSPLCSSSSSSSSSSSPCGPSYPPSALSLPDIPPLSTSVYSSTLTEDLFPWHYPAPRIGHKMVGVGHRLFLFGGGVWSFQQPRWIQQLHDFWVFDTGIKCFLCCPFSFLVFYFFSFPTTLLEGGHWYQPEVKGEVPRLCYPFFFVLGNYLFVAGGQTTGSNVELSEDFYYLDTSTLSFLCPSSILLLSSFFFFLLLLNSNFKNSISGVAQVYSSFKSGEQVHTGHGCC
ncbi:Host cell factor 1 [Balamuthia mandrillaris]